MKSTLEKIKLHPHYLQFFILSAVFMIFTVSACIRLSVLSCFTPISCSYTDDMEEYYSGSGRYINIYAQKLYYTGYDYLVRGNVTGHYYYSLENERCTVYLISDSFLENAGTPPLTLENVTFKAVLKKNDSSLKPLLEYMASDLNWNYSGLSAHTSTVVVSQYHYRPWLYIFLVFLAFVGIISTLISGIEFFKNLTKTKKI